jgi:deoxyribodipyrimidine photo-lyase
MRELWSTGWMHNRVRMVVASFLVKDLMIHWREGAKWFWDTLADADLANNTLGWQLTAGCGADAAPYFRIFNPASQGEKLDPKGVYVRRPRGALEAAGVVLGRDYPEPIIDHAEARRRALEAYATIKRA